jgi:hypothetical protein
VSVLPSVVVARPLLVLATRSSVTRLSNGSRIGLKESSDKSFIERNETTGIVALGAGVWCARLPWGIACTLNSSYGMKQLRHQTSLTPIGSATATETDRLLCRLVASAESFS